jgi:hypothetical protein
VSNLRLCEVGIENSCAGALIYGWLGLFADVGFFCGGLVVRVGIYVEEFPKLFDS